MPYLAPPVLLVHLLPFAAFLALYLLCFGRGPALLPFLARGALLGPGLVTLLLAGFDLCGLRWSLPAVGLASLTLLALGLARRLLRPGVAASPRPVTTGPIGRLVGGTDPGDRALRVAILVLLSGLGFWVACLVPLHEGDSLWIYAQSARVFAASGGFDAATLRSLADPMHPEYPPLVPALEALYFLADPLRGTLAMKPLFGFAWLGLLAGTLDLAGRLRPGLRGTLCVLAFVATPRFFLMSIDGYVDLRLLATLLVSIDLAREARLGQREGLWLWPLAVATLAATKNEGTLMALGIVAVLGLHGLRARHGALVRGALLALPLVLAWPLFAWFQDLRMGFLAGAVDQGPGGIERLAFTADKLLRVLLGHEPGGVPSLGVLGLAALLSPFAIAWLLVPRRGGHGPRLGTAVPADDRGTWLACATGWLAWLGILFVVFLFTPREVHWHLDTALPRLVLQGTPLLFVAALLLLPRTARGRR